MARPPGRYYAVHLEAGQLMRAKGRVGSPSLLSGNPSNAHTLPYFTNILTTQVKVFIFEIRFILGSEFF